MFKKIFITGGAGYVGTRLVENFLKKNYIITVYDTLFFDCYIEKNINLKVIKGDIRDTKKLRESLKNQDIFIHLACISNDASFVLDEKLSTSINFDAFEPMVKIAKNSGIKKFIYASTSSVYGISEKKNVTEDHPLVPLTLYNKFKAMCEPILFEYTDSNFIGTIFRPATVCGFSKRQRLDLSVNILTNNAYHTNVVKVFGGKQLRPNLHIQDYCDVVEVLINAEISKISNQIFNVGNENLSINQIAIETKNFIEKKFANKKIDIQHLPSDDNRSYHINSDKIFNTLGFKPRYTIKNAIEELCDAFLSKKLTNTFKNDIFFNVQRMLNLKIK